MSFDDFMVVFTTDEVPVSDAEALEWMNKKRAEKGLAPLKKLSDLNKV